jgi:hypothetical protein
MSSDTTESPSGSPGNRGRRRPGPTIELEATEIGGAQAGWSSGLRAASRFGARFGYWAAAQKERLMEWLMARWPFDWPWRAIGAGAAGAILVAALVVIASRFTGDDGRIRTIEARLARAEQQMREITGQAPPAGVDAKIDAKVIDDLTRRIARLEAGVTGTTPPAVDAALVNRIATLEGALKAIDERVGVVARRTDDIATLARDTREKSDATAAALTELTQKVARLGSASELAASVARIGALERLVSAMQADLAKRGVGETGDRPVRLAVTAAALNAAVERGDAFAGELAAAKALGADAGSLAPLEPFATTGLPPAATLARELLALMGGLAQTSGAAPRDGSLLERLQANAERLVRIRPLNEPPGDDPAAVLIRIEQRAAQSDLAGALAELAKLPAHARAPAQDWIAKAQARLAAVAASRRFAANTFAALGKTPEVR